MKRIILDTNFLLIPAQYKVDVFAAIEELFNEKIQLLVLDKSMQELDNIARQGRQKEKREVKLIKAILKTQNIKILGSDQAGSVDDALVMLSKKGYCIATQDRELKQRIKHNLLSLRQGKYVTLKE